MLAAAKSCNIKQMDELTRLDLLSKVETIRSQLDDPKLAMYRQLANVRSLKVISFDGGNSLVSFYRHQYTQTASVRALLKWRR